MEEWKEIKDSGYFASSEGRIKNKQGRILSGSNRGNGYLSVHINLGDGCKHYSIHRLILETFNPIPDVDLFHVDHIDKNKQNNRLENLRWVNANENNQLRNNKKIELTANDNIHFLLGQLVERFGEEKVCEMLKDLAARS